MINKGVIIVSMSNNNNNNNWFLYSAFPIKIKALIITPVIGFRINSALTVHFPPLPGEHSGQSMAALFRYWLLISWWDRTICTEHSQSTFKRSMSVVGIFFETNEPHNNGLSHQDTEEHISQDAERHNHKLSNIESNHKIYYRQYITIT